MVAPVGGTARTRVRRLPEKAVTDRAVADAVLDQARLGYVGVVDDGWPFVLPCAIARDGDRVFMHGSTGSRLFRRLAAGDPACLSVTELDGLVAARSLFESSMHYRSVMALGRCTEVTGDAKRAALDRLADRLLPGRLVDARPPTRKELAATCIVALPLDEISVKVSDADPEVVADDEGWSPWTGVVPLRTVTGPPVTLEGETVPGYVASW